MEAQAQAPRFVKVRLKDGTVIRIAVAHVCDYGMLTNDGMPVIGRSGLRLANGMAYVLDHGVNELDEILAGEYSISGEIKG